MNPAFVRSSRMIPRARFRSAAGCVCPAAAASPQISWPVFVSGCPAPPAPPERGMAEPNSNELINKVVFIAL